MWALRIAVSGSELGTRVIVAHTHVPVRAHGGEVYSTVKAARKGRKIDVERELLVEQVERLVRGVVLHEVQARADVRARLKCKREGSAVRRDTVGACVVSTIEGTVLRAGIAIRAVGGVPLVAGVAVLQTTFSSLIPNGLTFTHRVATNVVDPTPVSIKSD